MLNDGFDDMRDGDCPCCGTPPADGGGATDFEKGVQSCADFMDAVVRYPGIPATVLRHALPYASDADFEAVERACLRTGSVRKYVEKGVIVYRTYRRGEWEMRG